MFVLNFQQRLIWLEIVRHIEMDLCVYKCNIYFQDLKFCFLFFGEAHNNFDLCLWHKYRYFFKRWKSRKAKGSWTQWNLQRQTWWMLIKWQEFIANGTWRSGKKTWAWSCLFGEIAKNAISTNWCRSFTSYWGWSNEVCRWVW